MNLGNQLLIMFGTMLLGLSAYVLINIVEQKVSIGMLSEELLAIDKQMGRIYNHMDREVQSLDKQINRMYEHHDKLLFNIPN